jgi:hypothetical protein
VEIRDEADGDGIGHDPKDDWDRPRLPLDGSRLRELLALAPIIPIDAIKAAGTKAEEPGTKADEQKTAKHPCPCCGGPMIIIETFARGSQPKHQPTPAAAAIRIDTS